MESGVVHVIIFVDLPDFFPLVNGDRWVAGLREDGALEIATHEGRFAIDEELVAFVGDGAEPEGSGMGVDDVAILIGEVDGELIGFRGEF